MKTKTIYEEEILKEMHDLSEPFQEKMVKIVDDRGIESLKIIEVE